MSARSLPLLCTLLLLLPAQQRWPGAAAGGLADLVSHYVGGAASGESSTPKETAVAIAARNCAANGAAMECQPRTVLALQNGGPDTHPPQKSNKVTHTPARDDMRPEEFRYHTGSETTLTWSTASTEASIAALLLAALGPQIEASLAAEAWGPVSSPTQLWRVYRADGERVHSWADIVTAPTLKSIAEKYGTHGNVSAGATAIDDASATSKTHREESGAGDVEKGTASPISAVSAAWDVPALYVVPEGRLFMWPTYQIGQVVPVTGCTHGRAPVHPQLSLGSHTPVALR